MYVMFSFNLSLPIWCPGLGVLFDESIPNICLLSYFNYIQDRSLQEYFYQEMIS